MTRHDTTRYRTTPYQTKPNHTIPHHTIPYHTIPYHTIPYHMTYISYKLPLTKSVFPFYVNLCTYFALYILHCGRILALG